MLLTGCSVNEATGRRQLTLLSSDQANALGEESKTQFLDSYGGQVPSKKVTQYVSSLGKRLADESEMRELDWEFFVLDSAVVNAFALPGGKVYMSRGLLEKMTNEAQLAGVLGHEIGHVTAEHTRERMSQAMAAQLGVALVAVGGSLSDEDWAKYLGVGASAGATVYLLKFNRDQESEADWLGLRYMTNLGYDPSELIHVMQILKEASGGGSSFDLFATHPNPDARIQDIKATIAENNWSARKDWITRSKAFENNALIPMSRLPDPKHTAEQAKQAAQDAQDGQDPQEAEQLSHGHSH